MTAALEAGVSRIVPCLDVPEARSLARRWANEGPVLLGGERGGRLIPGFDLGNSPAEYTPDRVASRTLVFTTSNGTRAMARCVGAARVLIGCFVNRKALVDRLRDENQVEIVCAGTDGEVSWEDTLFAGALVDRLSQIGAGPVNDAGRLAQHAWRQLATETPDSVTLAEALRHGRGGRNLIAIGQEGDVALAARMDQSRVVPELDLSRWTIS